MAIYTFATVRDYVRSSIDEMEWYRPELILTQTAARDIDDTVARYLKIPVSLAAIFMFMSHPGNWENLKKCEELNTEESSPTNIRDSLGILQSKINCDIIEFDDQFHKKSLVYGITLNRWVQRKCGWYIEGNLFVEVACELFWRNNVQQLCLSANCALIEKD